MTAVISGWALTLALVASALLTGCGGRSSAPHLDDGAGGSSPSDGGSAPNSSVAGASAGMPAAASGAPASAGQSTTQAGGSGAHAGAPSTAGSAAGGTTSAAGASNGAGAGGTAGAGAGGTAGTGAGGTAGGTASTSGTVGAASASPAVVAACGSLCSSLDSCGPLWSFSPTCKSDCGSDLSVQNGRCADLGVAMSTCLEPYLKGPHSDCMQAYIMAQSICSKEWQAYNDCSIGTSGTSGSAPQSTVCAYAYGAGGDPGNCTASLACLDGGYYRIDCDEDTGGQSSCSCIADPVVPVFVTNQFDFSVNEGTSTACRKHIADCFASKPPSP